MRKQLSMNGRPKSSNKARGARHHAPGYVPSFSNVIAAIEAHTPKTRDQKATVEALIKHMKKLQKRIDKAKVFVKDLPSERETENQKELRAKILRWTELFNKDVDRLRFYGIEHNRIASREEKKFLRGSDPTQGVVKDDPWIVTENQRKPGHAEPFGMNKVVHDAISEKSNSKTFLEMEKDYKKSTSKNVVYKKRNPNEVTDEKRQSEEFKRLVIEKRKLKGLKVYS